MMWIYKFLLILMFYAVCLLSYTILHPNDKIVRVLILGETGKGKSTMIKHVFKAVAYVPIGDPNSWESETFQVDTYYNANGDMICDTPGMCDIGNSLTNEQILILIKTELTQQSRDILEMDALIIVTSTLQEKEQIKNHLREYITLFGEKIFESLIVVVNQFENTTLEKGNSLKYYIKGVIDVMGSLCDSCNNNINIPVMLFNCKNPTNDNINKLYSNINKVNQYELANLNDSYIEIKKIYDKLMNNTDSYRDEIKYTIVNETQHINKQLLQRKVKQMTETKCFLVNSKGGGFGVSFEKGKVKCKDESKAVEYDELIDVDDTVVIPKTIEETYQVLKNEEYVIWETAKRQYKRKILQQFRSTNNNTKK